MNGIVGILLSSNKFLRKENISHDYLNLIAYIVSFNQGYFIFMATGYIQGMYNEVGAIEIISGYS